MILISTVKILQVLDKIDISSGVSSVVMNYYKALNKEEIIFDFIVHQPLAGETINQIESNGSKVYIMPSFKIINILKLLKKISDFYDTHKEYQIIHLHIPNAAIFYLGLAVMKKIKHRIIHSHNTKASDYFFKRIRNYFLFLPVKLLANHFFACSQDAANFLFGKSFCKKKKVIIMPNAININKFRLNESVRNQIRKNLNLENQFVIGNIGRFCYQKNQDFVIDIFYEFHRKNPRSVLILLGDGELRMQLVKKIHNLSLENSVMLLGVQKDVHLFMQAMDAFILPSRFEGLPMVGIEAQAAGLPCLFSDTITKEALVSEHADYLKITDSALIWADKLLSISKESIDRSLVDSKMENFDMFQQAKKLTHYYLEIIK